MKNYLFLGLLVSMFLMYSCGEEKSVTVTNPCEEVTCSNHGSCLVVNDVATCECENGYVVDGLSCVDINECENNTHNCQERFECVNTDGFFNCVGRDLCENVTCDSWKSCNSTNGLCELKINRCDIQSDCSEEQICDENHNCINPVNPCEGVTCSNHGSCSVVNELATCNCENGYDADGLNCVDINECSLNSDNCHENADCTNQDGSFSCECKTGFSGDGVNSCEEITIDLCEGVICSGHGVCSVVNELATCECDADYQSDGVNCIALYNCDEDNMCLIPAGNFIMGKDETNPSDHSPQREVYLNSYKMDRYEVTVAKFRECVDAGICTSDKFKTNQNYSKYNYGAVGRDNHPMNGVNWYGAKDYCEWAGKRLPTEAEWEKAAKGVDNRIYPWGTNNPTCNIAVIYDCNSTTIDVGSKPIGISPYGIYDMSGNVSEWVADWFNNSYYSLGENNNPTGPLTGTFKVKRGGSLFKNYISPDYFGLTVFNRDYSDPIDVTSDIAENGFRCVKDVD